MTNQLPTIDIIFKQQAFSFVERSSRGNVILILRDSTDLTFNIKEYKLITEVEKDAALFTAENLQYIKDSMVGKPNMVTVVRIALLGAIADALTLVATLKTGWTSIVGEAADFETISTWTAQIRTQKKTYKAIATDTIVPPDSEGVVDLFKTTVTFKDATRGEQDSEEIIPTILGLLAGANVKRGTTYMVVPNLASVVEPDDVNEEIAKGKFVLINDDGVVKIALGINSLTTFNTEKTEDFSSIEIIEAMDMIIDDTTRTFKNDFISKYKNNLDNQMIFISAENGYYKALADEEVLDKNYDNIAFINVAKQRQMWVEINPLAVDWNDAKVKNMTYKKSMFVAGDIKVLQSITNLNFVINMA